MVENAGTMEKLLSQKIVSNSANDKWYEMKNMHIFFCKPASKRALIMKNGK